MKAIAGFLAALGIVVCLALVAMHGRAAEAERDALARKDAARRAALAEERDRLAAQGAGTAPSSQNAPPAPALRARTLPDDAGAPAKPVDRLAALHFETDFETALSKARRESKLVFLYATTPCFT